MLLLMQNMLPNCTLDDKQPIEKLFRQGSGNTCIHSLVEWKLDPCYQKDGFRFMTTGFCARKGRGTDDENQDGQEQTATPTASVEYFNYCIFYREFGDNDIINKYYTFCICPSLMLLPQSLNSKAEQQCFFHPAQIPLKTVPPDRCRSGGLWSC